MVLRVRPLMFWGVHWLCLFFVQRFESAFLWWRASIWVLVLLRLEEWWYVQMLSYLEVWLLHCNCLSWACSFLGDLVLLASAAVDSLLPVLGRVEISAFLVVLVMWFHWEDCSSIADKLHECKDPQDGYLLSRQRNPQWCKPLIFLLCFIFCSSTVLRALEQWTCFLQCLCLCSFVPTNVKTLFFFFLWQKPIHCWMESVIQIAACKAKEKSENLSTVLWQSAFSQNTSQKMKLS